MPHARTVPISTIALLLMCSISPAAFAQAQPGGAASTNLPAVNVDAPTQRKVPARATPPRRAAAAAPAARTVAPRRSAAPVSVRASRAPVRAPATPAPTAPAAAASLPGAAAVGPVQNYVPRVSATGTKTATPLIETPQSISVVGAEQIRDQNAQTVGQVVRYSSGIYGDNEGNDTRNDFLQIRGFPAQATGYFLDGLQLASPGFATFKLEPYNLERLEILKGPASVLYGGSNTGGIINGVSKRPFFDAQHGSLEFGVNNYGNTYGRFDLGGPVGTTNQWAYRVEGQARVGDTQTRFTPDDRLSIAPSLTFQPDASTSITVLGSYQKDRTRGLNFLPYVGSVVNAPFGKISPGLFTSDPTYDTFQRNQALIGYTAEHKFNDVFTVRQNFRFSDLRITDRTLFGLGYDGAAADANLSRLNFATFPHLREFALDTQGEARFFTGPVAHVALLGVDYKRYTFFDNEAFGAAPDLNLLAPIYRGATVPTPPGTVIYNQLDQVGIYAQDQAKLGPFTLVLSGRQDSLRQSVTNELNATASAQENRSALTGRVGLIYTSPLGIAPYATYATSFDPQIGFNGATQSLLAPQTGQLTEVGIKYQPIGTNLSFTAALFNLVQQNVSSTNPATFQVLQTGEEQSRGFELEAQGKITDGLKLLASYTGFKLRDTRDPLNPALVGTVPVNTPQNFGALFLDYTVQTGPLAGFGFGAGVRYTGGSYAQDNSFTTLGVPSFVLGDATIHYEREAWRAQINVSNFTNRTYVTSCSSPSACFYGEKLKATASLAYRW